MPKVIAYGPEILALEPHFDGQTVIIYGYQRFFIKHKNTLYCNLLESEDDWIIARLYTLTEDDMTKFETVFPQEYTYQKLPLTHRNTEPVQEFAETYTGKMRDLKTPLDSAEQSAYTLFDNLRMLLGEQFAAKFALSTHVSLESSLRNRLTSYFTLLDEVDMKTCEQTVLLPSD